MEAMAKIGTGGVVGVNAPPIRLACQGPERGVSCLFASFSSITEIEFIIGAILDVRAIMGANLSDSFIQSRAMLAMTKTIIRYTKSTLKLQTECLLDVLLLRKSWFYPLIYFC